MRKEDLITILAGAVLAYVAYKTFTRKQPVITSVPSKPVGGMYAKGIANSALPGQEGYGWQYFSDGQNGTAISPNGDYYLNGNLVWSAP